MIRLSAGTHPVRSLVSRTIIHSRAFKVTRSSRITTEVPFGNQVIVFPSGVSRRKVPEPDMLAMYAVTGVGVAVAVGVNVWVGVGVRVGEAVGVGVWVLVGVGLEPGVNEAVTVNVGVNVGGKSGSSLVVGMTITWIAMAFCNRVAMAF